MTEKKGNALTQMALIADLLEKINLESSDTTVVFNLNDEEYQRILKLIYKKLNLKFDDVDVKFSVNIGEIEFVFVLNTNNV